MGWINIPREEQEALQTINTDQLKKLIELSLDNRNGSVLRTLRLESCGEYVGTELRGFEAALAAYGKAKAASKLSETERDARRAGSDLAFAVGQMKHRAKQEHEEDQRFYVEDDLITPPHRFSEHLSVRVSYRCRPTIDDPWHYGSITFTHDVNLRPDYTKPLPKRKPSAAELERDKQDKLFRTWDHLRQLGLSSVRDFLRNGGDTASIPKTFQVKTDSYSRGLNNFSAQFWSERH